MDQILINQSVAILCDGNNIERSIHDASKNKSTAHGQQITNLVGVGCAILFRQAHRRPCCYRGDAVISCCVCVCASVRCNFDIRIKKSSHYCLFVSDTNA